MLRKPTWWRAPIAVFLKPFSNNHLCSHLGFFFNWVLGNSSVALLFTDKHVQVKVKVKLRFKQLHFPVNGAANIRHLVERTSSPGCVTIWLHQPFEQQFSWIYGWRPVKTSLLKETQKKGFRLLKYMKKKLNVSKSLRETIMDLSYE